MVNYWELQARNVGEWMSGMVSQKIYKCRRSDGRFELGPVTEPVFSNWHFINPIEGANCTYLHKQLFDDISTRTPIGRFVPRRCQSCWKIQFRPKNLEQLFAIEALLTRMDLPSKCGIERRAFTPMTRERYGAYIYSNDVNTAFDRLEQAREEVKNDPAVKDDTEVVLKRGCTEMELTFFPSSDWRVSPEQNGIEDLLDRMLINDIPVTQQPKHLIERTHMNWIEWAAENGDHTYLNYTDGKRLYPLSARYERATETEADTQGGETVPFSPSAGEVPKGMGQLQTKENVK